MVFSCVGVSKAFGADVIIENVSFLLEAGEKAAIVGVNGAGKTTLLKIIAGELSADSGSLVMPKELSLGYLSQITLMDANNTVYDEMLSVFLDIIEMEGQIRELERRMADLAGETLDKVMEKYSRLTHEFEERKGYEYQSRLRGVIKGLGFDGEGKEQQVGQLSGGEKTRVSLGKLLLTAPDLLLLDEPTNHLDVNSIEWLEDFIKSYSGAVLIVSHDRYFIDRTVSKIIEIENSKSCVYEGDYRSYAVKKAEDREVKLRHYLSQQKEIHRQEEVIKTLRSFNREKSIKRAESREKMLEKMVLAEKPESEPAKMKIQLAPKKQSGTDVLTVKGISKAFGERQLFKDIFFEIKKGDKVALLGANGIGKTTLFRMLLESMAKESGEIRFGYNVTVGYYDQEQQNLDNNRTVLEEVTSAAPNLSTGEIRNVLAAFVFVGDDVFKKVGTLSGGEKGRVALAKLMLQGCNLLMLDEPTNHLDIFSKEILEGALNNYEGTVFYISHDRYFVNNTARKILELTVDGMKEYLGNYDYYMEKKNQVVGDIVATVQEVVVDTALDYKSKKEKQSEERRRQTQLTKTENEINRLEELVKVLEDQLCKPEICADYEESHKIFLQKQECEERLLELYSLWDELYRQ